MEKIIFVLQTGQFGDIEFFANLNIPLKLNIFMAVDRPFALLYSFKHDLDFSYFSVLSGCHPRLFKAM